MALFNLTVTIDLRVLADSPREAIEKSFDIIKIEQTKELVRSARFSTFPKEDTHQVIMGGIANGMPRQKGSELRTTNLEVENKQPG